MAAKGAERDGADREGGPEAASLLGKGAERGSAGGGGGHALLPGDEEFVVLTPWQQYWPRRWTIVLFALTADLICYIDRANLSVAMLPMATLYGWDKDFQGLCFAGFFIGLFGSHIVGGHLADVFGAKSVLAIGVFWWSAFTAITPLAAPVRWLVILARIGLGLGEGVCFPSLFALFAHWFPRNEKTVYVSVAQNGVYIGTVLAMLLVPVIEQAYGWEAVFYIFGAVGIVWAALFWAFGHSRPALDPTIDPRECRYIEAHCVPENADHVPWSEIAASGPVWALGVAKFGYYFGFFTVLSWQPTYYYELGMARHDAAYASAIPFTVTAVSVVLFAEVVIWLTDAGYTLSEARKIVGGIALLGPAVCFALLCFITDPWQAVAVMSLLFALSGAFVAGVECNVLDLAPQYAGSVMAFTHTISTTSGIISNILTGLVLTRFGHFESIFGVCATVSAIGGFVYILFSKQHAVIK